MYIRKKDQFFADTSKVRNEKTNSQEDTYSCDYINNKDKGIILFEGETNENIPLNDDLIKYKEIEVYFFNKSYYKRTYIQKYTVEPAENIDAWRLNLDSPGIVSNEPSLYIDESEYKYDVNNKILEKINGIRIKINAKNNAINNAITNLLYVTKIVGYK